MLSAISFEIAESMYVQPKVYRKPSFNRVPEKILQPQLYRTRKIKPLPFCFGFGVRQGESNSNFKEPIFLETKVYFFQLAQLSLYLFSRLWKTEVKKQ